MMHKEKVLEYMGEIEEQYIEEAGAVKENGKLRHKKKKRFLASAACIALAALLCGGAVMAKTCVVAIRNMFSTKEESGYDLELEIKKLPDTVFSGKVEEVHDILVKQFEEYEPIMSWYPGAYSVDFSTVEEAASYLGIDFLDHPLEDKPESVTVDILGLESGAFTSILVKADYKIEGTLVQVWSQIYTDAASGEEGTAGLSVEDGSLFDTGERSFLDKREEGDRIIYSQRAAEYLEYQMENGNTGSGQEAMLLCSSSNENQYVSQEGIFVKKDVLYMINVAVKEGEKEKGRKILESILEQY